MKPGIDRPAAGRRVPGLAWAASVVIAPPTLVLLALGAGESTPADDFGLAGFGGLALRVSNVTGSPSAPHARRAEQGDLQRHGATVTILGRPRARLSGSDGRL